MNVNVVNNFYTWQLNGFKFHLYKVKWFQTLIVLFTTVK